MFIYFYRIYDRLHAPGMQVVCLGVLTDAGSARRPDFFATSKWGCSLKMKIPIVKLIDFRDKTHLPETD